VDKSEDICVDVVTEECENISTPSCTDLVIVEGKKDVKEECREEESEDQECLTRKVEAEAEAEAASKSAANGGIQSLYGAPPPRYGTY
jgi:hypothetical protein